MSSRPLRGFLSLIVNILTMVRIWDLAPAEPSSLCRYTCRGLFEVHKLLFSFQMCVKILEAAGKLNMSEYHFFLRGGIVRKPQECDFKALAGVQTSLN